MIMKKNPQIIKLCEQYDIDSQKNELINQLQILCGGDLEASNDEEAQPNNNVEGVKFIFI